MPKPFRVVSWNVLNRNHDADLIAGFARDVAADVVAFQELTDAHVAALRQIDGYHLTLAEDFIERDEVSYLGLLTLAQPLDSKIIDHNPDRRTSASFLGRRMRWVECLQSQSASFAIGDRNVRIVNLHLSCAVSPKARASELDNVSAHFAGDGPVIICGDFNCFARPWLNPAVGWAFGFKVPELLVDERRSVAAFARDQGLTVALPGTVTVPRFRLQLDHILVRGLTVRSGRAERRTFGSDHRPIIADLTIPSDTTDTAAP